MTGTEWKMSRGTNVGSIIQNTGVIYELFALKRKIGEFDKPKCWNAAVVQVWWVNEMDSTVLNRLVERKGNLGVRVQDGRCVFKFWADEWCECKQFTFGGASSRFLLKPKDLLAELMKQIWVAQDRFPVKWASKYCKRKVRSFLLITEGKLAGLEWRQKETSLHLLVQEKIWADRSLR